MDGLGRPPLVRVDDPVAARPDTGCSGVLALAPRAGSRRVYDRAVRHFDPHEIAEAPGWCP